MPVIRINQGDQYSIPIALQLNGEDIDINHLAELEVTFENGLRKMFPQEVQYNSAADCFYLPLPPAETFEFPANGSVTLDPRVKFVGGNVIGAQRMDSAAVADATSEVVL